MKNYELKKIEITKLYFFSLIGILTILILFFSFILIFGKILHEFIEINIILIFFSLIGGTFAHKIAEKKSIKNLTVNVRRNELVIEGKTFALNEIEKIELSNNISYYPKISIVKTNGENLNFRIIKNQNNLDKFFKKLTELKINGSR